MNQDTSKKPPVVSSDLASSGGDAKKAKTESATDMKEEEMKEVRSIDRSKTQFWLSIPYTDRTDFCRKN